MQIKQFSVEQKQKIRILKTRNKMYYAATMIKESNSGVQLFESGRFHDAAMMFLSALEKGQDSLEENDGISHKNRGDDYQWSSKPSSQALKAMPPNVHSRCLTIQDETPFSIALVGTITYNLALTSQLRCIELEGEKRKFLMGSTVQLYSRAKVFLVGTPFHKYVANNMLHLYRELNQTDDAQKCLDELSSLVVRSNFSSYRASPRRGYYVKRAGSA